MEARTANAVMQGPILTSASQRLSVAFLRCTWFLSLLSLFAAAAGLESCARAARISAAVQRSWAAAGTAKQPLSERASKTTSNRPRSAAQTATLDVTFGLRVVGVAPLPHDFVPNMNRSPLWLGGGKEIAVIGNRAGKGVMLGFSGVNLATKRVVIEDYGAGAPHGSLLDVALGSDGHTLATAVAAASRDHLDLNLTDVFNNKDTHQVASLEGEFDSAQLAWLSSSKILVGAQAVTPAGNDLSAETAAVAVSGLYLIRLGRRTFTQRLNGLGCSLSPLAFSPKRNLAVAQGADGRPPAIVDLHSHSCVSFPSSRPVQVLGWAPDSVAFLYRTADGAGVFRFDPLTGSRSTIAISSGAAAYASDWTIIALGSQELSWRRVVLEPMTPIKIQIALFDPRHGLKTINSLGFETQAALLAQSSMVFSQVSNDAIIDIATNGGAGLARAIIEYSYPSREAFLLAHGPLRGPVTISWSPDGQLIAIVDGYTTRYTLAVIAPPK